MMETMLFYDMIYKEMKVYVEDMVVKLATRESHFEALENFLQKVLQYKLKLTPSKCVFWVISRKLLGHHS